MIVKKIILIFFLAAFLAPIHTLMAQQTNAGFVQGNIWYSKDPFEEGDRVKIYTLIFNPDKRELSGTVVFFDKDTLLGIKDFIVAGASSKDLSINWTVTAGSHTIFGQIENAKFLMTNGKYEDVALSGNKTENSLRIVEKIVPQNTDAVANRNDSTIGTTVESIKKVEETVQSAVEKVIPESVSKPISATVNSIEAFRNNTDTVLETKKTETKNEISALSADDTKKVVDVGTTKTPIKEGFKISELQKPFDYVKLFFLYIFAFVFQYKILFYGILAVLVFLFLRMLWHFVF